jgi:hypothetical protein
MNDLLGSLNHPPAPLTDFPAAVNDIPVSLNDLATGPDLGHRKTIHSRLRIDWVDGKNIQSRSRI